MIFNKTKFHLPVKLILDRKFHKNLDNACLMTTSCLINKARIKKQLITMKVDKKSSNHNLIYKNKLKKLMY